MTDERWWVLRVIPNTEIQAEKLVKRLGYEAMAPYVEGQRHIRRGVNRLWKFPLFPGYVFASWPDWSEGWNKISHKEAGIAWVYDFLKPARWSQDPSTLKMADVEYLKSIADGRYKPGDPELRIKVGDYVMVSSGPFQGCSVTVLEISGKNATIEVPEAKMTSNVKISLAKLEKV